MTRAERIEEAFGAFCPRCLRGDHSAHGTKNTPNGCLWCRCGHLADCGCGGCEDLRAALALPDDEPGAEYRRGVEDAARVADEHGEGIGNLGDLIRALAPPATEGATKEET